MKKYYYYYQGENLGMCIITKPNEKQLKYYSESEDEALIEYYKSCEKIFIKDKLNLENKIAELTEKFNIKDNELKYLKEKYPEEFV